MTNIKIDDKIREYGRSHRVPISLDDTLEFLIQTIKDNACTEILEIGTAIGYSAIAMAENVTDAHIDSVEIDLERYNIACNNVSMSKLDDHITVHNMDALEYLKVCQKKYDFIYLDGPKGQYIHYLPYLIEILKTGGIIFADNLYFHGMVTGAIPVSKGCRAMIKGLHKYIDAITTDPNLDTKIYDIGDGVGVSRKIK